MADQLFSWYDKNDGVFYLNGLRDSLAVPGVYLNAGVTMTVENIRDVNAVTVTGPAYPVAGAYVAASNGLWAAAIGYQAALKRGVKYWAELKAVASGKVGTWLVEFEVRERVSK